MVRITKYIYFYIFIYILFVLFLLLEQLTMNNIKLLSTTFWEIEKCCEDQKNLIYTYFFALTCIIKLWEKQQWGWQVIFSSLPSFSFVIFDRKNILWSTFQGI